GGSNEFAVQLSRTRVDGVTVSVTNQTGDLSPMTSVSATVRNADGDVLPDLTITDNTDVVSGGAASFTIDDVPVGTYQLCVTGMDAADYGLSQVGGECVTVSVAADAGANEFAVQLSRTRVNGVTVSVTNQTGDLSPMTSVSATVKNNAEEVLDHL